MTLAESYPWDALASTLLESDAAYFEAGALVEPLPSLAGAGTLRA
jgi:hypothetical protein